MVDAAGGGGGPSRIDHGPHSLTERGAATKLTAWTWQAGKRSRAD